MTHSGRLLHSQPSVVHWAVAPLRPVSTLSRSGTGWSIDVGVRSTDVTGQGLTLEWSSSFAKALMLGRPCRAEGSPDRGRKLLWSTVILNVQREG